MFLGLTFASYGSKAQTNSTSSPTSQTEEVSAKTDNLLASAVETTTTFSDNSSVIKKSQNPRHPKKEWQDRTLGGKILVVVGGTFFVILCLMFGTVSVG